MRIPNRIKQKGFTLIELLVVVAIIGMLTSIIMVSFGNTRMRARDTKRLSDMNQVRTGLDLYFNTGAGYPDVPEWNSGVLSCGTTQIMEVPRDPQLAVYYTYLTDGPLTGCGGTVYMRYAVEFTTEGQTDIGPAGTYYMSQLGFTTSAPF